MNRRLNKYISDFYLSVIGLIPQFIQDFIYSQRGAVSVRINQSPILGNDLDRLGGEFNDLGEFGAWKKN